MDDHLALVDAYERGDLAAAKRIVIAHNERAKATSGPVSSAPAVGS